MYLTAYFLKNHFNIKLIEVILHQILENVNWCFRIYVDQNLLEHDSFLKCTF